MLSAEASSAICVQRFDGSRFSAIHTTYRISLRSSSLREPRYPLLRVVLVGMHRQSRLHKSVRSRSVMCCWLTKDRPRGGDLEHQIAPELTVGTESTAPSVLQIGIDQRSDLHGPAGPVQKGFT